MPSSPRTSAYRLALALAMLGVCVLVWLSLGVGIIGRDGDPANLMYFAVVAAGVVGAIASRLHPLGMARALATMAIVQAAIAAIALANGLGLPWSGPAEILLLNGFFVALFAGSAWLFRRAAQPAQASLAA